MKSAGLALVLALAGCGGPRGDGTPGGDHIAPVPSTTTPVPTPGSASIAPPTPSASTPSPTPSNAPAEGAAKSKEELEWANDGCTFRKSTNVISACTAQPTTVGAWKPTKAEIAPVLKIASGLCYCAKPVEKPVLTCMDSAKAPLVSVTIGKQGEDTECTVHLASAEFGGRRWVRLLADNRDRATFFQVEAIVEVTATGPIASYEGFEPLTEAMVRKGESGVSPQLRADWATLPADAKVWLTTR